MLRILLAGAAGLATLLPTQAYAQNTGEIILYANGRYAGPHLTFDGPAQAIGPFTARSVKLPETTSWELCSGNRFTGCRRFSQSNPGMVMTVRSVRPVGVAVAVPGGTVTASGQLEPAVPSPSLRGIASEYFIAPQANGNRIAVKPATPKEATRRAGNYCRSIGWGSSAHADLQTAGGSVYLVDVLCVR
jgi:hypothetical protein